MTHTNFVAGRGAGVREVLHGSLSVIAAITSNLVRSLGSIGDTDSFEVGRVRLGGAFRGVRTIISINVMNRGKTYPRAERRHAGGSAATATWQRARSERTKVDLVRCMVE